jgi:hypothetical protein
MASTGRRGPFLEAGDGFLGSSSALSNQRGARSAGEATGACSISRERRLDSHPHSHVVFVTAVRCPGVSASAPSRPLRAESESPDGVVADDRSSSWVSHKPLVCPR